VRLLKQTMVFQLVSLVWQVFGLMDTMDICLLAVASQPL